MVSRKCDSATQSLIGKNHSANRNTCNHLHRLPRRKSIIVSAAGANLPFLHGCLMMGNLTCCDDSPASTEWELNFPNPCSGTNFLLDTVFPKCEQFARVAETNIGW
jgi:hypothetical protein